MVIVEGPDGAGKTTLIGKLCDIFDTDIMPRACTSDNAIDPETLRQWVDDDLLANRDPDVKRLYDRHPLISEPIYGPLIRGRMADGFADLKWLASRLTLIEHDRHALVVFCLPPEEVVIANVAMTHQANTEHLRGVLKNSRAIYHLYTYLAARWAGPSVVWDYTDGDKLEALIEEVRMYL